MRNSSISEFHLWAALEKPNADCWGAEVMRLSTSCFSPIAVIIHHDRSNLWRKGFIFSYNSRLQFIMEAKSREEARGRKLEAGTTTEAMEVSFLSACSF